MLLELKDYLGDMKRCARCSICKWPPLAQMKSGLLEVAATYGYYVAVENVTCGSMRQVTQIKFLDHQEKDGYDQENQGNEHGIAKQ